MKAPGAQLSLNPGRPRAIDDPFKAKITAALKSAQAARDAVWKSVAVGKNSFRRTRRPRLTLAEALGVARAAGYDKSETTFVRLLAAIRFETAQKYWHRRGLVRNYRARKASLSAPGGKGP